ncbi:hypothetical protein PGTUg99_023333 [Puccinia graminis f. sp. tritici]|uniref:Uncharacterized protein n=1 Tax=Puccinia graminis f. sp. tritici TaxID=56615 RepID=A0A5B0MI82_PUCGR|nr:hypothetical protein PGTUg99_023333 [Puccinia graminis f. sp. tritici]
MIQVNPGRPTTIRGRGGAWRGSGGSLSVQRPDPSDPTAFRGSWVCSEGPETIRRRSDKKTKQSDEKRQKTTSWGA